GGFPGSYRGWWRDLPVRQRRKCSPAHQPGLRSGETSSLHWRGLVFHRGCGNQLHLQVSQLTRTETMKKIIAVAALGLIVAPVLVGCTSDANTVSRNLSAAAEQFEVERRITAINGITNDVMMEIEGRCSIETGES